MRLILCKVPIQETKPDHNIGCVGSLTFPANHVTLKMQETGLAVHSPYLRKKVSTYEM